jgi:hypothetical protein
LGTGLRRRVRRFESCRGRTCDVSRHRKQPDLQIVGSAVSCAGWWAWREAAGLVVAPGVGDQFAEEFAGGGGHDAHVEVLDEQDDGGFGRGFGRRRCGGACR